MSDTVSRNRRAGRATGYALLLRATALTVPAPNIMYAAAASLAPGRRSMKDKAVNEAACRMVSTLLGYPEADHDMVEHVLRTLPDPTKGQAQ